MLKNNWNKLLMITANPRRIGRIETIAGAKHKRSELRSGKKRPLNRTDTPRTCFPFKTVSLKKIQQPKQNKIGGDQITDKMKNSRRGLAQSQSQK
jgi:hypothetical protein